MGTRMTITVLFVLVYLTNGAPLPNMFVLPPGHPCDGTVASDYARRFVAPTLPDGSAMQDPDTTGLHICLPVPAGPGPGPAMHTGFQGDREA